ncbi:MAG: Ku protein [Planctomycetia bacterium]|nr:Ku protein [Planctomycetia bacterium]
MAPRSTWKGFLKLSLISLPVKAFNATSSDTNEVRFNQLHAECNSRIQYKKWCPIHNEISHSEIVSGYEYAKGQYVIVDTDELEKLRSENDKAIKIETFVSQNAIDPVFYSDKTYYLVPDGPIGEKPYVLLQKGMVDEKRYAIAQVVLNKKEQLVLLRPMDRLIAMTVLNYANEINSTSTFDDEVPKLDTSKEETNLMRTVIGSTTDKKFDFTKYKDVYAEKLIQLVEAKVAGKEIVSTPQPEETQVINLMDALRQSVAKATGGKVEKAVSKPPRKMAESTKGKTKELRRKSS